MRHAGLGLLLFAMGCADAAGAASLGSEPADGPARTDAAAPSTPPATSAPDAGSVGDASGVDAGAPPTYRSSLSVCWTDPSCKRALTIAHGGDWSYTGNPYDSDAALAAAYANGADGVKIDGRITKDGVVVVAHSSPLEIYESADCYGKKIEEMTAAEVTLCHRLPSQTETFQRLDAVLAYLRGKLVAQICVKRQADTAGIAAAVVAAKAEDFAFLEISTSDLQTLIAPIPGADKLWYLINVRDVSEVDTLLGTINNPRAFMYEFEPTVPVDVLVATRLHPAGIRSFAYDKQAATAPAIKALFDASFDVVSTNATAAAVQARVQVNSARGISPP